MGLTAVGHGIELYSLKATNEVTKAAREKVGGGLSLAGDLVGTFNGVSAGGDERAMATTKAGLKIVALALPGGVVAKVATDIIIDAGVPLVYNSFVIEPREARAFIANLDRLEGEARFRSELRVAQRGAAFSQANPGGPAGESTAKVFGQGSSFQWLENHAEQTLARKMLEAPDCADGDCDAEADPDSGRGSVGWRTIESSIPDMSQECENFPKRFDLFVTEFLEQEMERSDGYSVCSLENRNDLLGSSLADVDCKYYTGEHVKLKYNFVKEGEQISVDIDFGVDVGRNHFKYEPCAD